MAERFTTGLFQSVEFATTDENPLSVKFTEVGTNMLLIQSPSTATEGIVVRRSEIRDLRQLLNLILAREE